MILIIDDDIAVRTSLLLLFQNEGYTAIGAASEKEALTELAKKDISLIILDLNFSIETSGNEGMALLKSIRIINTTVPVILLTGWGTIELAVQGMKAGANDFINKPWSNEHLIQSVKTLLQLQEKKPEHHTRKQLDSRYDFKNIIGEDPRLLDMLETIGRVAATDASVLITGESGTGKELVAEAIHQNSLRSNKIFVKVNLGGISTSLFESEMFGHVRGAFTDARTDRVGRFEMANKGTIFLDEIDKETYSLQQAIQVAFDRNNNLNIFMRNFAEVVRLPEPSKKITDLHKMIRNITSLMQMKADEKQVQFELYLPDTTFYITADEQQMDQILINIVKNAIEAIGEKGILSFTSNPGLKQLTITDSGSGISENAAGQLFSPFFSTKKDGQGIGLTLVKEILLNHGCEFTLQTMQPGETTFLIRFGE